ncbi:MAG: transposase, partial [Lachnospiraceae bacterium]|nr:transposase [Lachnospiraceae bacterium]
NDEWAQDVIMSTLGVTTGTDLQKLGKKERDVALWKLKAEGLSIRQIERLTGIGRNIVLKARGNF